MHDIGSTIEILPAFSSETGRRDLHDEFARCEATILQFDGPHVLVSVKAGSDVWIPRSRIKPPFVT